MHGPTRVPSRGELPLSLGETARLLRAADPCACLFFDRTGTAGDTLEVWLDARPDVRAAAARLLRVPGGGWVTTALRPADRPADHLPYGGHDVFDELAAVSSELALHPLGGDQVDFAVAHLRGLFAIAGDRAQAIAFECWRHWSATLSPTRRVAESVEAALRAGTLPHTRPPRLAAYLTATERAVLGQRSRAALPAPYLVFTQALGTHARLALPPSVGAAAALTVRNELADRTVSALSGRSA